MPFFKKSDIAETTPSELDKEVAEAFVTVGARDPQAPVDAGLAKETLIAMMFRHADMLAGTMQVQESSTLYELATHLAGVDNNSLTAGKATNDLRALGNTLMTAGRFQLAIKVFEQLIALDDANHEDHTRLGALYFSSGEEDKSRKFLKDFFREQPVEIEPCIMEGGAKGAILLFNGFSKTDYKVGLSNNGRYEHYRSGGHFMLNFLLDTENYDVHRYVIADSNLDQILPETTGDLLLNNIADADSEYASLKTLEAYLAKHPHDVVINHPSNVLKTTRDGNYQRLNAIPGIRFPRTERFNSENDSATEIADRIEKAGFNYPFIIRRTGTHTAVSTERVNNRRALDSYLEQTKGDCFYVIEFVENKSEAGHYSKMRFFAIDGTLYPVVYHIDQVWNVHGDNRKVFMADYDWMVEKEEKFMNDPASVIGQETYELLQSLPELIGLEFFGFDFTLLDNGDVLIFELNPAMRHSFKHAETFEYLQPHMQAISDAFATMIETRVRRVSA